MIWWFHIRSKRQPQTKNLTFIELTLTSGSSDHKTFTYRLVLIQTESVAVCHRHKAAPPFSSLLQVLIETSREDAVACQRVLQEEDSHETWMHVRLGLDLLLVATVCSKCYVDDTVECENDKFHDETSLNCARVLNLKWSFQTFREESWLKDTHHPLCFQVSCLGLNNHPPFRGRKQAQDKHHSADTARPDTGKKKKKKHNKINKHFKQKKPQCWKNTDK